VTTTTLRPTGDGTYKQFPGIYPTSPTTHYDKVDEASQDGDLSFIGTTEESVAREDTFTKPDYTLPSGETISKAILYICARRVQGPPATAAVAARFELLFSGTPYITVNSFTNDTYVLFSHEYTSPPWDPGTAWEETDVDSMEFGVQGISASQKIGGITYWNTVNVTQTYLEVLSSGAAAAKTAGDGLTFFTAQTRRLKSLWPPLHVRDLNGETRSTYNPRARQNPNNWRRY